MRELLPLQALQPVVGAYISAMRTLRHAAPFLTMFIACTGMKRPQLALSVGSQAYTGLSARASSSGRRRHARSRSSSERLQTTCPGPAS